MNIRGHIAVPRLYPICCLTVSYILGIYWQSHNTSWYYACLVVVLASLLALAIPNKTISLEPIYIFLYAIFFLAGCHAFKMCLVKHRMFSEYADNHTFDLVGTVEDIYTTGNPRNPLTIRLAVHSCAPTNTSLNTWPHRETLLLYTDTAEDIAIADTLKVHSTVLKKPKNNHSEQFLIKQSVSLTANVKSNQIERIASAHWSLCRFIGQFRQRLLQDFKKGMNSETYMAFGSIFLGEPTTKKHMAPIKTYLKIWGLFHYIARAGLHLVIFILIWSFVLNLLPIKWAWRQLIIILMVGSYFILTWPSIPFNRAFFTFILNRFFVLLGKRTYYIPILSIVTLVTLLENPIYLFCLDFQLSFGITYALAWFNEIRYQCRS